MTKLETMIGKAGDQNNSFNGDVFDRLKDSFKFFVVKIFHFEGGGSRPIWKKDLFF